MVLLSMNDRLHTRSKLVLNPRIFLSFGYGLPPRYIDMSIYKLDDVTDRSDHPTDLMMNHPSPVLWLQCQALIVLFYVLECPRKPES